MGELLIFIEMGTSIFWEESMSKYFARTVEWVPTGALAICTMVSLGAKAKIIIDIALVKFSLYDRVFRGT